MKSKLIQEGFASANEKPNCWHCYWWTSEIEICSNPQGRCEYLPIDDEQYDILVNFCDVPKDCLEKSTVGRWKWKR